MPKKVFFFIRIFITLAIFFALFYFIPYQKLVEAYKDAHKNYLFFAFLIFWASLLIAIARWRLLLLAVEVKASFREIVYSYFCGLFLNLFFPSVVAGDFFRGFGLFSRHGKAKEVASTILIDRFSGGLALFFVATIGFFFLGQPLKYKEILIALFVFFFIILFLTLLIFSRIFFNFFLKLFCRSPSVYSKILSLHSYFCFFKKKPAVLWKVLILSFFVQFLAPVAFFVSSRAFGLTLSFTVFLAVIPIIMILAFIPITIAGAGTREAATVYFFTTYYGVGESIGLGMSLVNLIYLVSAGLLGGVLYVAVYHRWLQSSS